MATSRLNFAFQRHLRRLFSLTSAFCRTEQGGNRLVHPLLRRFHKPLVGTFPVLSLLGWSWGDSKKEAESKGGSEKSKTFEKDAQNSLLETADRLYSEHRIDELYDLLEKHKDENNDEVLWRLARAAVDKGKAADKKEVQRACYYEAFEYVKRALAINQNNYAVHKWYAILLDYTGEYEGMKQRIKNSFEVKNHFMRAVELNPKDATSIHSLGYWCYVIADLKWYERQFASAFYEKPPTATFQEALNYFLQAEETEPNFYTMNLLMLGKTYMKLQDAKMAYRYLQQCMDQPLNTPDDRRANAEARQLLKTLTAGAGRKTP